MIAVELIRRSRSADAIGPWGSNRPSGLQEARRRAAPTADQRSGCDRRKRYGERAVLLMVQLNRRWLGDETRAALAGEIGPEPLVLHAQPVLQLRQGEDVNERPHQPRQEAAGAQPAPLQHRVIFSDDCHVALVEIVERTLDLLPL